MLPVQRSYVNSVLGVRHGGGVSANTKPGRVMICVRQKRNLSQHSVRVWQWAAYLITVQFVNKFHCEKKKKLL